MRLASLVACLVCGVSINPAYAQQTTVDVLSFLLFPVDRPQVFDAVVTDEQGNVLEIQVKHPDAKTNWIWGAFRMPGHVLHELEALWRERGRRDE